MNRPMALTASDWERRAWEMWRKGKSLSAIGKELGISSKSKIKQAIVREGRKSGTEQTED